jgi:hypothetical protein
VTHVRYLVAGYASTFVALAGYAAWIVARARGLARSSPAAPPQGGGTPRSED